MKLYVCWGTFKTPVPPGRWVTTPTSRSYEICWGLFKTPEPGHPCRIALDALRAVGHEPEVIRSYGWGLLPAALNRTEGRRLARKATGKSWIPLLLTDNGEVIVGTGNIKAWAAQHPGGQSKPDHATSPVADGGPQSH